MDTHEHTVSFYSHTLEISVMNCTSVACSMWLDERMKENKINVRESDDEGGCEGIGICVGMKMNDLFLRAEKKGRCG